MRNALWHLQHNHAIPNIREDTWHLNALGHSMVDELFGEYFDQSANHVNLDHLSDSPFLHPEKLPSMIPNLTDAKTYVCDYSESLKGSPQLSITGRDWKFDADDRRKVKWGWITHTPSSTLEVAWRAPANHPRFCTFFIGFEKSFHSYMSDATLTCTDGCTCSPSVLLGLGRSRVTVMEHMPVSIEMQSNVCRFVITLNSNSAPTKFKVGAIIVTSRDANMKYAFPTSG